MTFDKDSMLIGIVIGLLAAAAIEHWLTQIIGLFKSKVAQVEQSVKARLP